MRIPKNGQFKILGLFILIILLNIPANLYPGCNPVSAELCTAIDDISDVYINGVFVTTTVYCDIGWDCEIACLMLSAAELALLQDTGNLIAVRLENTDAHEMWASWSLDITCDNGDHAYVSSGDGSDVSSYYDDSDCPADPAPDDGTYEWYDPLYDEGASGVSWVQPAIETGHKWGKRLYDPETNDLAPALSYTEDSETGVDDCKQIFFRQGFDLTPDPTPEPPDFTIEKSASQTDGIQGPGIITFTLHVCNTGDGTGGLPVEVIDSWTSDQWQFQGPYGPFDSDTYGRVTRTGTGTREETYWFTNGFPGHECYDIWFTLQTWNPVTECITWYNNSQVNFEIGDPQAYSTVELRNFCPSPTVTPGPADFTLSKTANKTTDITDADELSYTLVICNNGDYVPAGANINIIDDWSSSPDNWSFNGPYNITEPNGGNMSRSGGSSIYTWVIDNGFPGGGYCFTFTFGTTNYGSYTPCVDWHNDAFLVYQMSPTLVATVDMENYCPPLSPTFTATPTYTVTYTFTPTPSPSPTPSPMPTMDVTKTANVSSATIGDMITFTLAYHNTGSVSAPNVQLWDTIPAAMSYVGCSGGCSIVGNIIVWNLGTIAPGGSGSVTWWGTIDSYPYNPLYGIKILYADKERDIPEYFCYYNRFFIEPRKE